MSYATTRDNDHSARVINKCKRIEGLEALIKSWEENGEYVADPNYLAGLKVRLLLAKNQLKNMRP